MSDQLLNIFKLCLLGLVYLFLLRVVRAVWVEIGPARTGSPRRAARPGRSAAAAAEAPRARRGRGRPAELATVAPADRAGRSYALGDELTIGRAAGCQISVEDTYVSQVHARVFTRDGQLFVEDLGSTNGTYLNRAKVSGPMAMRKGDRVQVGNTVLELR